MTEEINEKNLIEQLRLTFPELENSLQERLGACKGEGLSSNYEVVGSVFKPKLKEELSKGELTEFLRRAALFIERVCASGDPEAINVVWIKVFEWLLSRPKELDLLWRALGSATKESIKDAARRWSTGCGRVENVTKAGDGAGSRANVREGSLAFGVERALREMGPGKVVGVNACGC